MPVNATCGACGRNFLAPAQFQGKRVKCKGCGQVFTVPSATAPTDYADSDAMTDPLATLAAVTTADSMPGPATQTSDRFSEEGDDSADAPEAAHRRFGSNGLMPNVLTFNYPGSEDVDRWLPICLIVLGFLLLMTGGAGSDTKGVAWIPVVRFLTPSLLYWAFTFPITLLMLRKAAHELRFAMPPNAKLRVFACYMPAFVITAWLQMSGQGLSIIQLFGCILGLMISSCIVWLLFRLREEHIGTTVIYGAGGFAAGAAITLLATVGLNQIGGLIVQSGHSLAAVPVSPFGAGMIWPQPSAPVSPRIVADTDKSSSPADNAGGSDLSKPDSPANAPVGISAGMMGEFDPGAIPGAFDDVIFPLSNSPVAAIIRNNQSAVSVECWNTDTWANEGGTLKLPSRPAGNIFISSNGEKLAWIAEFPKLCIQVWSVSKGSVVASIDLERTQPAPVILGFIGPDQLLLDQVQIVAPGAAGDQGGPAASAPTEPGTGNVFDSMKYNPKSIQAEANKGSADADKTAKADAGGDAPVAPLVGKVHHITVIDTQNGGRFCNFTLANVAVAPGDSSATNTDMSALRAGQNFTVSIERQRFAAAVKVDGMPALVQIDLSNGTTLNTFKVTDIDPNLPVSPTGLAYSGAGQNLAAMFENAGQALLLSFESDSGKKSSFVYPAGPLDSPSPPWFGGSSLCAVDPVPGWLVYGQGIISSQSGSHLKDADLKQTFCIGQRLTDNNRVQLLMKTAKGLKLKVLVMDTAKLIPALDELSK